MTSFLTPTSCLIHARCSRGSARLTPRLVTYLSREESIKSLLGWVTSGLDELDAQAESSEDEAYHKALKSEDVFPPFTATDGPLVPGGSVDNDAPNAVETENVPMAPGLGIGLGQGFEGPEESENADTQRAK